MSLVKKTLLLFVMMSICIMMFAENRIHENKVSYPQQRIMTDSRVNLINESFTAAGIPQGWGAENLAAQWTVTNSANAGGAPNELRLKYTQFNGTTRFYSPVVDASAYQSLTLEFKHMVDFYASPMTVGVATRSSATDTWTTVWSASPTDDIDASEVSVNIQNDDIASSTFQICFFFTGNLYNLDYWYIDNVRLFYPEAHDMGTVNIAVNTQYEANTPVAPVVTYKNAGLNNETTEVFCKIYQYDQLVYTQSQSITINSGATQQVTFPAFTPTVANEMYKVEAYTNLATDTEPSNNLLFTWFDTYNNPRQKVILEIGTGTWCQYCPGAAMGAEDLHANGQEVGVIEYHNGDTYVTPTGTARISYYGVAGFPTSIFDGGATYVGGSNTQSLYNQFLPLYNASFAKKTPLNISIAGQLNGNDLSVNVTVDRFGRFLNSNAVVHFAITESGIAQNWQGQTVLDFVERTMLPDANGTVVDLVNNQSVTIPLTTTLGANWNHEEIELVAFVQDPSSKVIYQGFMIPLSELGGAIVLNPPTNLVAQVTGSNVNLTWTAPDAGENTLNGYKVYRDGTAITPNTITATQYLDSNVPAGAHAYTVKAIYTEGESAPSNTANVTIGGGSNTLIEEGFEGATFPPTGWTLLDADGDNNNWAVFTNGDTPYSHTGLNCAKSDSYINNVGALTPDNYLITSQIQLPVGSVQLKYWVAAQDPNWASEHYSVLVSTTNTQPASFTSVFSETLSSGDWAERTVSLSNYAGQTIYLAFRHHDVTDMFAMKIDDLKIEVNTATDGNNPVAVKNSLGKNYPNPFNPSTTIEYSVKENTHVSIEVFNVKGQKVRTLVNENKLTGNHSVVWDGKDEQHKNAGSGVYFYKMTTPNYSTTHKMIMMK